MISRRTLMALPVIAALPSHRAFAQDYPSKPIRIIVPIAPGTATDGAARQLGNALASSLHGTVIVENKVGADGVIATDFVARSAPDGYTLLATISIHYINQWLKPLSYDAVRDFEPIVQYGRTPVVLVTAADSPMRTLRDVVDAAKRNPGQLSYASAASTSTMTAALMENIAGIKLRMIPYNSSPQTVVDAASKVVDMTFAGISSAMAMLQSGRVRALAVSSDKRSPSLPDVPTFAEAGLPGYDFASPNWILAPRGVPPDIVARLSDEFARAASTPEFKQFSAMNGFLVDVLPAAAVKANAASELDKWGKLVAMANLKKE